MPQDRSLLLMSMVLQGAIALTFGLAFLGLWKGFHRPTAARWAAAWLMYAVGVVVTALGLGMRVGASFSLSPIGLALLSVPLQLGVVLFRAGTDSLIEGERLKVRRYATAGVVIFGIFVVLREAEAAQILPFHRAVGASILPRALMGVSYAWAAWPLRRLARRRWPDGYALMAGALVCLSARMFVTAGFEAWKIGHGRPSGQESLALTAVQLGLLITFGLAAALVLVEAERVGAIRATETILETAEALSASDARFRFVVEHTSDVQALVGATDHRIRYIAPSCERVIGLPPSALEGRIFEELIHPDDSETVTRALEHMQAEPSGRRPPTTVRMQNRSGEWLALDVTGQLVEQEGGAGPTIVLSIRDMTAQRKLEAALLHSTRMDSLGRMAGTIAHDFNNMLMVIAGGIELTLAAIPTDSPLRPDLEMVRASADRGRTLTRQLLTFARQHPPKSEPFDVHDRLATLEGVVAIAVGRAVRVRFIRSDQPLVVRADPAQFDQVIMNLSINARDAMPSGGLLTIQSSVATEQTVGGAVEPPATRVFARVMVQDTGVGIPREHLDRIFEPFFTTKAERHGTGLGLASAYGFARQAGGSLSVESTVGIGTRLFLDLPLESTNPA